MEKKKLTFALFFGNRGFFPGELIAAAREDMQRVLTENGYDYIIMDAECTRYGAVETIEEGKLYHDFLEAHKGAFDGVILSLPNFGDENGATVALRDAGVPILVQAYPDEAGKMDFAHRRDSLCGKIAMCNVLRQCNIPYTLTKDATVAPNSEAFKKDLSYFAAICRVVRRLKHFNIGAIGARTTAFKTVRVDEIAMQRAGINIETIDLSLVFDIMDHADADLLEEKKKHYASVADFGTYPPEKLENIARLGVAMDALIADFNLQAVGVRCWEEFQKRYGIAPCLVLSDLNERGIPAACELDVNNAVMMYALQEASEEPVMLLDVNNNYDNDLSKTILFHCAAIPASFYTEKPAISEHLMFKKSFGAGSGVGIVNGEICKGTATMASFKTEDGDLHGFAADVTLTEDTIEDAFFGCGVVAEAKAMPEILQHMLENGYRHHVAIAKGEWADAINEAMEKYLGYKIKLIK